MWPAEGADPDDTLDGHENELISPADAEASTTAAAYLAYIVVARSELAASALALDAWRSFVFLLQGLGSTAQNPTFAGIPALTTIIGIIQACAR